ncbi:hypothetical protein ABH307_00640 [Acinetobacter pittii]|uniref:hypothetical protein n=1 Tax=Acinetobacter pittii TaxID=48296 RepID=UPI0032615FDE
MLTAKDIIIENEKDKRIYDYLIKIRGEAGINHILKVYFSGGTKPYISNLIKYSKIEIPEDVLNGRVVLDKTETKQALENIKKLIKR